MKRRENIRSKVITGLIAIAALVLSMLLVQAKAADTDLDGIYDTEETNFHFCRDESSYTGLLIAKKDLFYVLIPASPTLIPADLDVMEFISAVRGGTTSGGLDISTRKIDPLKIGCNVFIDPVTFCDRCIISREDGTYQFATRITESLDVTDPETLGEGSRGIAGDNAVTYTQRIKNKINAACNLNTSYACVDADGVTMKTQADGINPLFRKWVKHDVAHETGHALKLTKDPNQNYGGYHYAPQTDTVMEQYVVVKVNDSKKKIIFYYISNKFSDADRTNMYLKYP